MGFFFRKSLGKGPLRINLSKSGIGWSFGVPGLRFGRSAKGQNDTRAGIPGTGLGWRSGGKSGCLVPLTCATVAGAWAASVVAARFVG